MKKKGLGKGLSALISASENFNVDEVMHIEISKLVKGRFQPRKLFDQDSIEELAESIKSHGIIQPIIVKKNEDNKYEIIAGERRWRASQIAGLKEVPAIVRDIDENKLSEQALIENIQRQNLTPVEESEAYNNLLELHNYTQEELSKSLGKARSHIANMLRINNLPSDVKGLINEGKLSFSHVKVIASSDDVSKLAQMIADKGLNVRQTESLVKNWGKLKPQKNNSKIAQDNSDEDIISIERVIEENIGIKAKIEQNKNNNGGKITLLYNNYEELDSLIEILTHKVRERV